MFAPQVFLQGLGVSTGLIVAIGAQNAHVLRTGVRRQHVLLTVITCVLIDALLIGLGVGGMGAAISASPLFLTLARWGGALFLLWYGLRSWAAVLRPHALQVDANAAPQTARAALLSVLALSLLNPHVYLDTLVLLGAVGGSYPAVERASFAAGAMSTSLLWFCALGFGAQRLSAVLQKPLAWKCIEVLTGATMLAMAAGLAVGGASS